MLIQFIPTSERVMVVHHLAVEENLYRFLNKKTHLCASPPVARSCVGLSVRRRSTAAALAQTVTPDTQESR